MDAAGEGEFVGNCSPIILKTMPESKDAKGVFDGLTTQAPFWHVDALIVMRKKKYAHRAVMCPPSPVATQPIAGQMMEIFFSKNRGRAACSLISHVR